VVKFAQFWNFGNTLVSLTAPRFREHIYHVLGQQDYERTIINEHSGERYFGIDEEKAKAAG
jgi:hypothetical protein